MSWPNLVTAYIAGVKSNLSVGASVRAPAKVEELPGFVRVTLGPGSDDTIYDSKLVDFDVFAPTYGAANDLAESLRVWVLSTQNTVLNGSPIGRVRTATTPMEVDWGNPNVTRFVYSARVSTARQ